MSRQRELHQYFTPLWVAEALVERHFPNLDGTVVEPSCGPGSFLRAIPDTVNAIGVEIDPVQAAAARCNTGRQIIEGDFATVELGVKASVIIGNPPFNTDIIDSFLDRGHALLEENGRLGFILPAYALQTASRVARYSEMWSLFVEMIPRNIFPGLEKPLVFAIFSKDRRRTMIGLALYKETADVNSLPAMYATILKSSSLPIWRELCATALNQLGGTASLEQVYKELERAGNSRTKFWREKIRQTVRRYSDIFVPLGEGQYQLRSA